MASIQKINDRKFKITVSNGYHPDGRKIAKARTIEVPKNVQARGVMQYVNHEAEEFEREVKLGYSEDGEMTFEEFSLRWLNRHAPSQEGGLSRAPTRNSSKYAVSTLGGYRKLLERCYPYIGQIKLNRLRPIAIEKLLIELRKRTFHGRPIKEVSVQKYLVAISAVLSDAKRNEIISKNPARMIDLPPVEKTVQTIPSDAQIKTLITALLDEPEHYRYFYFLAIYTGCRRGELCGLKWSDVKTINGIPALVVSRSRSSLPYSGVVEKGTKNNKERTILLSREMYGILEGYWYIKKQIASENKSAISDYMFTDDKGKLIHPDTFSKRLRKIYDRLNYPKEFHLHTLRHYFVTALLQSGVDKNTVADLAGHGDTSFLERTYCHPRTLAKQKAAVGLANMLFGGDAYVDENGLEQPFRTA